MRSHSIDPHTLEARTLPLCQKFLLGYVVAPGLALE